jgi:Polyketide cyclase / dehydrase and lipid transport
MRIEARTVIEAPLADVFKVVADLEHWPDWEKSFVRVALASGSPGVPGAKYTCTRKIPQEVESAFELTVFDPGKQVAIEGDWIGSFRPAGGYALTANGPGSTEVTSFGTPQLRGFAKLMTPMLLIMGQRLSRQYLGNLAEVVRRGRGR